METEEDMNRQELNLTLDREKALRFGIDPGMISGAISYAVRGNEVGYFYEPSGRQLRIRIWLEEEDRDSMDELRKINFDGIDGSQVPLESLVRVSYDESSRAIQRQDRKTVLRARLCVLSAPGSGSHRHDADHDRGLSSPAPISRSIFALMTGCSAP